MDLQAHKQVIPLSLSSVLRVCLFSHATLVFCLVDGRNCYCRVFVQASKHGATGLEIGADKLEAWKSYLPDKTSIVSDWKRCRVLVMIAHGIDKLFVLEQEQVSDDLN